jgi:putative phosphoesterase
MKFLITSDIHGNVEALKEIAEKHKDVDYHLNAGDMCMSQKHYERYHLITVKGNNDFGSNEPYFRILELDGLKVFISHGHLEHVKFGLDKLIIKAKLHQADLCIFGHTHERYMMVEEGILLINPGSLGDYHKSYAIYEDGQVAFMNR